MVIIETSIFTKIITSLLSDEEYREFQNELRQSPTVGKLISGSGDLGKYVGKFKVAANVAELELFTIGQPMIIKYLCSSHTLKMKWKI